MTRIYLVNVGTNTSHRFQSPIFQDGRFEFLPIPEGDRRLDSAPHAVRYRDLRSHYDLNRDLREYIPDRYWNRACHRDPDFETFTYGDSNSNARAAALERLERGDVLLFLAGLKRWPGGARYGFYLIGGLRVDRAPVVRQSDERFARNAHVIRGDEEFRGVAGSDESRRFDIAVPVNRNLCEKVFRAKNGAPWNWDGRSELAVIGSYTRTCRRMLDTSDPEQQRRSEILRKWVAEHEPAGAALLA